MKANIKQKLASVKQQLIVAKLIATHSRTPWLSRILLVSALTYAASPIDIIPDFIPVIGYLDDLLIVPGAIWLAYRLIPADVISECRQKAAHLTLNEETTNNDIQ